MSYEVSWKEPNVVLHVKQIGAATIEELRDMNREVIQKLDSSPTAPIFIVWDIREMTTHPNKIRELMDIGQPLMSHNSLTAIVFIGLDNSVIKFMVSVINSVGKMRFHTAINWDDVDNILNKLKSTYPTIKP